MSWEHTPESWLAVRGSMRARWAKLSDDDLDGIDGRRDGLIGKLRELYGSSQEGAEAELRDWERHQEPIAPPASPKRDGG